MDNHFHIRVKEIHDGLNSAILERTVNIVYDLLRKYFFRSDEERDSFKVVGSIRDDGIEIDIVTPGRTDGRRGLIKKPVKQASMDKSGYMVLSRLSSAKSGLSSAYKTDRSSPKRIGQGLRPVTDKLRKVEKGYVNARLKRESDKSISSDEFMDSPSFRDEYGKRIERFISEHMDEIYEQIKSPISKVEKNA